MPTAIRPMPMKSTRLSLPVWRFTHGGSSTRLLTKKNASSPTGTLIRKIHRHE